MDKITDIVSKHKKLSTAINAVAKELPISKESCRLIVIEILKDNPDITLESDIKLNVRRSRSRRRSKGFAIGFNSPKPTDEYKKDIIDLKKDKKALQQELIQSKKDCENLTKRKKELQKELTQYKNDCSGLKKKKKALQKELTKFKNDNLLKSKQQQNDKNVSVNKTDGNNLGFNDYLSVQIDKLRVALVQDFSSQIKPLSQSIGDYKKENNELNQQLIESQTSCTNLEKELTKSKKDYDNLNQKYQELEAKLKSKQQKDINDDRDNLDKKVSVNKTDGNKSGSQIKLIDKLRDDFSCQIKPLAQSIDNMIRKFNNISMNKTNKMDKKTIDIKIKDLIKGNIEIRYRVKKNTELYSSGVIYDDEYIVPDSNPEIKLNKKSTPQYVAAVAIIMALNEETINSIKNTIWDDENLQQLIDDELNKMNQSDDENNKFKIKFKKEHVDSLINEEMNKKRTKIKSYFSNFPGCDALTLLTQSTNAPMAKIAPASALAAPPAAAIASNKEANKLASQKLVSSFTGLKSDLNTMSKEQQSQQLTNAAKVSQFNGLTSNTNIISTTNQEREYLNNTEIQGKVTKFSGLQQLTRKVVTADVEEQKRLADSKLVENNIFKNMDKQNRTKKNDNKK